MTECEYCWAPTRGRRWCSETCQKLASRPWDAKPNEATRALIFRAAENSWGSNSDELPFDPPDGAFGTQLALDC